MTKIGNRIHFLFYLVLLFLSPAISAQNISVTAALTETNIFAGESVRLDVSVSGQSVGSVSPIQMPGVNGLRWLSNSSGQSTNYTYVNGRPSITYTYNFHFIAETPGDYTFPALDVEVNGEYYKTQPVSFKIIDPSANNNGQAARSPDIYVRLEPSTTNPVVGQMVIADVVLYFKSEVEVSSFNPAQGWKAEGFWKEDLENRQQARTTSTLINGVRYQRARLLQYAVFPTKAGELTLSPYTIVVQVRQRNRRRDIFSFGLGQERKELSTLPVKLDVAPVPEIENGTFTGAVGKFQISRTIKPNQAFVGESVEITTTISGEGNLPLISKPTFDLPENLETYDPQESSNISRANRQISGSKVFTDIVIARNEGTFEIPEEVLTYYNPELKRHASIRLPKLTLTAERDPRAISSTATELRFDIEPITGLANWSSTATIPLKAQTWVWVMLFLPVASLIGAYWFKTYRDRMTNDTAFARSQKAKEQALKELDNAKSVEDIKTGYFHIERALVMFITDKLNLPKAGLSTTQLMEELSKKAASTTATEVKRLLDKCATIAYAPNTSPEGLESDRAKAEEIIKEIGRQL